MFSLLCGVCLNQKQQPSCHSPFHCLWSVLCSYMYLGMALYKLSDIDNAVAAYVKAISLGPADPLLHLNYGKRALTGVGGAAVAHHNASCNMQVLCRCKI